MRRNLNLGILAHVDAGKTSLTERLLYEAGVIDRIGRVDDGTTQTDLLDLERRRGITIQSAVVSFDLDDLRVNLIDTPGHPDFIAEVERVLGVLDGAVLVVSAVEGVQSQTRVLMRTLRRLKIPTLLFVNKIDRAGAEDQDIFAQLRTALSPNVIGLGRVSDLGRSSAAFVPYASGDPAFADALLDLLTEYDDGLLADYLTDDRSPSRRRLQQALAAQTAATHVHPVCFGSAVTGAGLDALRHSIQAYLPAASADPAAELLARVFKVQRGPAGDRIAMARVQRGTIRTRDVLRLPGNRAEKVTAIAAFDQGRAVPVDALAAGRIGRLYGLHTVQVGDWLGRPQDVDERQFPPPTLETVVFPNDPRAKGRLHSALSQLAEQDPLINLRQDDVRSELYLSLYGEVQKEVIQTTLAEEFGIAVSFRATTTICIERPAGVGAAVEFKDAEDNPFLATIGLRIEPAPVGSGIGYQLEVELGSMPFAFMRAVQDTVGIALQQGLHGWPVTDCLVSMTHSGYFPRQSHMGAKFDKSMSSTAGDFRNLTPLVALAALSRAGTVVAEPIQSFELDLPADSIGPVLTTLARCSAVPLRQQDIRDGYRLFGDIPAARVHELQQSLPALTHGRGVLATEFDRYAPVPGTVPERPRTDHNPLDRKEYLLHVERQV